MASTLPIGEGLKSVGKSFGRVKAGHFPGPRIIARRPDIASFEIDAIKFMHFAHPRDPAREGILRRKGTG